MNSLTGFKWTGIYTLNYRIEIDYIPKAFEEDHVKIKKKNFEIKF